MDIRFGDLERALIKQFKVPTDRQGAFRARIRRFRDLNVPNVTRVGSGTRTEYSRLNAVELSVALRLTSANISPRAAADIVLSPWLKGALEIIDKTKAQAFVIYNTDPYANEQSDDRTLFAYHEKQLLDRIKASELSAIIDLPRLVRNLDVALSEP